jgi:hypothetical protein
MFAVYQGEEELLEKGAWYGWPAIISLSMWETDLATGWHSTTENAAGLGQQAGVIEACLILHSYGSPDNADLKFFPLHGCVMHLR